MIEMALSQAAHELNGRLEGADGRFSAVTTDSRRAEPGQLFVALRGDRFDGHGFVDDVGRLGAAGVVVDHLVETTLPQVVVEDTRRALGDLGRAWRRAAGCKVVGVTGSNGKTTVKEMLAAILARVAPSLSTQGNLNNDIGVPLTLLQLDARHRFAVVEMGASHAGEIAYLASLAEPDVGVVTNAGPAHLEGFGSIDGVARAKGELFEALGASGTAVINADDDKAPLWRKLAGPARIMDFGFRDSAAVHPGRFRGPASGGDTGWNVPPATESAGPPQRAQRFGGDCRCRCAGGSARGYRRGPGQHAWSCRAPGSAAGPVRRAHHRRQLQRQSGVVERRDCGAAGTGR